MIFTTKENYVNMLCMETQLLPRKRIENISQIFDGSKLLFTDFSNLNLSNIDLSAIPTHLWENCIFYNTNFSNTGIKFIPNKLYRNLNKKYISDQIDMSYCDFSDNDLSYLTQTDFFVGDTAYKIRTRGCDFRNTHLDKHSITSVTNHTKLDSSYAELDYSYWDNFDGHYYIELPTLIENPFLKISSSNLVRTFEAYVSNCDCFNGKGYHYDPQTHKLIYDLDMKKTADAVAFCEEHLYLDKQGHFKKLYELVTKDFSIEQKYWFFRVTINDTLLKDIDLSNIPISVLRHYYFDGGNTFDNVTISNSISELIRGFHSEQFYDGGNRNQFKSLYLPNITFGSWKEKQAQNRRISSSPITFFTKVYLELSRACNAKCKFCRNETFEKSKYDLERIAETLESIKNYINAVVIGGGEPTLRLDDVVYLKERCDAENIDWHMFTNGTNLSLAENDVITDNFKINLSRHAVNDLENAQIFGLNSSLIMTQTDIENLNKKAEVTLNATCFKGGLDTPIKILEYIDFAKAIGCKKVLIQNLQRNSSLGLLTGAGTDLNIDDSALAEVIAFLQAENFKQKKYPIYASGGYVTYIFKDKQDDFTISIQKYLTKEDLSANWPKAIKRAFDLSIDPSGNLYENWHQNYGKIDLSLEK